MSVDPGYYAQPIQDGYTNGHLNGYGDGDGYDPPPNSPAEGYEQTVVCPACNAERTFAALSTHAAGLGQPVCVVCQGACDPNADFVYVECGHPVHAACMP